MIPSGRTLILYDNTYSVDNGQTSLPISEQTITVADLANFSGLTALNVYAVNVSGLEVAEKLPQFEFGYTRCLR